MLQTKSTSQEKDFDFFYCEEIFLLLMIIFLQWKVGFFFKKLNPDDFYFPLNLFQSNS